MKNHITSALTILTIFLLNSTSVLADDDYVCPNGTDTVEINVKLSFQTSPAGCPFLENNSTQVIGKFFPGSQYPGAPLCVSGTVLDQQEYNSTITINGVSSTIIAATSESAQRVFAEAMPFGGLFLVSDSFLSGAASSIIGISWMSGKNTRRAKLFTNDRFTVATIFDPPTDYEEFKLEGVSGEWKDVNNAFLTGQGVLEPTNEGEVYVPSFLVTGKFCAVKR